MRLFALCAFLGLAVSGWAKPFTFSDDFGNYPAGADGAPTWSTGGIGWAMGAQGFRGRDRGRDFALLTAAPAGKHVSVQAVLTVHGATVADWKVAGVCVQADEHNYWHLALVESSDAGGKAHFVELSEMLDDTWNAQSAAASRLTQTANTVFAWLTDHPYRLRVELTPAGITGTVSELDGTVQAKIGFAFDQKAVTAGKPGLDVGGLDTAFTAFTTTADDPVELTPAPVVHPPFVSHGDPTVTLPATGYFSTAKLDDTWWFVDPLGHPFYAVGVDHVNYNAHWCEKLGYAPYHRNVEKQYGSEAAWAKSSLDRLNAWGFTALGGGASAGMREKGLAHEEFVSLGTDYAAIDPITPKTTWTGFPNVFSPKFRVFCEKQTKKRCTQLADDPWVIGYFIDNELEWGKWTAGGPFADSLALPADNPAHQAVVALLKARHATVAHFNAAWGTRLASLDKLGALAKLPDAATDAAKADVRAFIRLCAEQYFSITTAAIRAADPHHLILGCRFAGWAPDIWDIAGKYCDVVTVNCYRKVDLDTGQMADDFPAELAGWQAAAGKPMMITEWSFPALDAGLPCKHGAGQRVATQARRAFAFTAFQRLLFTTPYVIGSNFFMWADEPALGISATFPEDSNYGLVNEQDVPYSLLTNAARVLHPLVYDLHSGRAAQFVFENPEAFTVRNTGKQTGTVTLIGTADGVELLRQPLTLAPGATYTATFPTAATKAPGGHFLMCRVEPANPLLVQEPERGVAMRTVYTPGLPWSGSATERLPWIIINPTPLPLPDVTVIVITDVNKVPTRFVFNVGDLPAWGDKTIFDIPGKDPAYYALDPNSPSVETRIEPHGLFGIQYLDNQRLCLVSKTDTPNFFTIWYKLHPSLPGQIPPDAVLLGDFRTVVWQYTDRNLWVSPVKMSFGTNQQHNQLYYTFTATFEPDPTDKSPDRPRAYEATYRFLIEPGHPWFTSQLISLKNTDTLPMHVKGYYHYLTSNIGGKGKDDVAREYYWENAKVGYNAGVLARDPRISVNFWKDDNGGEHPDALRTLDITLQPGESFPSKVPEPRIGALFGKTAEWPTLLTQTEAYGKVQARGEIVEIRK